MIDPALALLPVAQGRQIKALATTAAQRSVLAPDIATAAESGMPGLEFASWYGVCGPRDLAALCNGSTLLPMTPRVDLAKSGRLTDFGSREDRCMFRAPSLAIPAAEAPLRQAIK
jgi:hypothetical protein